MNIVNGITNKTANSIHNWNTTAFNIWMSYILPLSIVPVLAVWIVGLWPSDRFINVIAENKLTLLLISLYVGQLLAIEGMTRVCQWIGKSAKFNVSYVKCLEVITISMIPLWLGVAFIVVPNNIINSLAIGISSALSVWALYAGIKGLFSNRNDGRLYYYMMSVLSAGFTMWGILLISVLVIIK